MGNISNLHNKNNLFSINEVGLAKVYIYNNQKNMARHYGLITREVIPNKIFYRRNHLRLRYYQVVASEFAIKLPIKCQN